MKNNIDEDIKILEHLSRFLQLKIDSGEHKIIYNKEMCDEKIIDCMCSLENILSELNKYQEAHKILVNLNSNLKSELETYKKIAEKLADEVHYLSEELQLTNEDLTFKYCDLFAEENKCENECSKCIIDWARKEVENGK